MAREDVVQHDSEEEDLRTAMQNIPIPFNELGPLSNDSFYSLASSTLKDILEDPNSSRELEDTGHKESFDDSNSSRLLGNSSNPPTATSGPFCVPKRPRNKKGRPRRRCEASLLLDSKVDVTEKSCSHCHTTKTPLWREGPRGAGTLCNACGVRYRTGRLLPEYRPASSPDFKPNVHSNFHRKVMEIRKETRSPPG